MRSRCDRGRTARLLERSFFTEVPTMGVGYTRKAVLVKGKQREAKTEGRNWLSNSPSHKPQAQAGVEARQRARSSPGRSNPDAESDASGLKRPCRSSRLTASAKRTQACDDLYVQTETARANVFKIIGRAQVGLTAQVHLGEPSHSGGIRATARRIPLRFDRGWPRVPPVLVLGRQCSCCRTPRRRTAGAHPAKGD